MPRKLVKTVWAGMFFLAFIAVAVSIGRIVVIAKGPRTGPTAVTDTGFATHTLLTLVHIFPGLLFILLAPLQFAPRIRARYPQLHRWSGRLLLVLACIIGVSAMRMSLLMAIGGVNEIAATFLFDLLFLFCLAKGYAAARHRNFAAHREWMIRMFGIALGIATTRPVMGVFFATSRLTHMTPHEFFGIAFWIGFSVTLIAAESWINYTREMSTGTPPARIDRRPASITNSL